MTLKKISSEAIERSLALAERYRLLNEPEQAASICHDVLEIDQSNAAALHTLVLALTEQFPKKTGANPDDTLKIVARMASEYDRIYHAGLIFERWARALLGQGAHVSQVGEWLHRAIHEYEKAEAIAPDGNEDAILRWNACARLIAKNPKLAEEAEFQPHFGD